MKTPFGPMSMVVLSTVGVLVCCAMEATHATGPVFRPGQVWNDTAGRVINAHGGGLLFYEGTYYCIASGCTGWDPNPARSAVADSIWGPWQELGNPCTGNDAQITYRGQSTFVFPVVGKPHALIFMADRWNKQDLPDSRYLWLPLQIRQGKPVVAWEDAWDLTWFDRAAGAKQPSPGNTRYFLDSVRGNDAYAGTSPEKPWQTIDRANRTALAAGDQLLLAGGQTFHGTLSLGQEAQATKDRPIIIRSVGQGRATLEGGKGSSICLHGCAYVKVSELSLMGCGRDEGNEGNGLEIHNTRGVEVDRVDVSGFRLSGVATNGDADTRITRVTAYSNGFAGISAGSGQGFPRTTNLYIGHCVAHDNPGDPKNPVVQQPGRRIPALSVSGCLRLEAQHLPLQHQYQRCADQPHGGHSLLERTAGHLGRHGL